MTGAGVANSAEGSGTGTCAVAGRTEADACLGDGPTHTPSAHHAMARAQWKASVLLDVICLAGLPGDREPGEAPGERDF